MSKTLAIAALSLLAATLPAAPAVAQEAAAGAKLYAAHCASCHGPDRAGMGETFPALTGVGKKLDADKIKERIKTGGGLMPPFGQLTQKDLDDLAAFLKQ